MIYTIIEDKSRDRGLYFDQHVNRKLSFKG